MVTVAGGCAVTVPPESQSPRQQPARAMGVMATSSSDALWRRRAFERQHGGRVSHPAAAAAVARIVADLSAARGSEIGVQVNVLRSRVPNAYILASGDMYVTLGMLEMICTDDELAAVVAHELSHLDDLAAFDTSGMNDDQRLHIESEADDRAVFLLLDAGYEPAALFRMISRLTDEQPAGWARHRCRRLAGRIGHPSSGKVASFDGAVPSRRDESLWR